ALNALAAALYGFAPQGGDLLARLAALGAERPLRFFTVVVAASALDYVPLAVLFTPWEWSQFGPFGSQLSRPLHYAVFFFLGLGAGAYGIEGGLLDVNGLLARRWLVWSAAAVAGFLTWIVPTAVIVENEGTTIPGLQVVADVGFVIACATACFS